MNKAYTIHQSAKHLLSLAPGGGGALNFFQLGVCGPDFRSVGLAN